MSIGRNYFLSKVGYLALFEDSRGRFFGNKEVKYNLGKRGFRAQMSTRSALAVKCAVYTGFRSQRYSSGINERKKHFERRARKKRPIRREESVEAKLAI